MVHFGEFLETWSLWSNSVTRQDTFNRTKIGGNAKIKKLKCDILSNFQMWCKENRPLKNHSFSIVWQFQKDQVGESLAFVEKTFFFRNLSHLSHLQNCKEWTIAWIHEHESISCVLLASRRCFQQVWSFLRCCCQQSDKM